MQKIKFFVFCFLFLLSFSISFQNAFAFTEISADITDDTYFTKENNPYVITSSVAILPGATLTIGPGVILKLEDSSLTVLGSLIVNGEQGDKVYFTSFYDDSVGGDTNDDYFCYDDIDEEGNIIGQVCDHYFYPNKNDWGGIYFVDSHNNSIKNTVFKYAEDTVFLNNSYLNILESDISDSGSGVTGYSSNTDANGIVCKNLDLPCFEFFNNSNLSVSNSHISEINNDAIDVYNDSSASILGLVVENLSGDYSQAVQIFNHSKLSLQNSSFKNCSGVACVTFYDGSDYTDKPTEINIENSIFDGGLGSGILSFGESNLLTSIHKNIIKNFSLFGVENYGTFVVDAKNNFWGDSTGPYNLLQNSEGLGNPVSDNVSFKPFYLDEQMQDLPVVPNEYYAKITNFPNGVAKLYKNPSVSSSLVKTLPNNWIVKVLAQVDDSGQPIFSDGYYWSKVEDLTDQTVHYMFSGTTPSASDFLPYEAEKQIEYAEKSGNIFNGIEKISDRKNIILEAVDHYYNDTNTDKSLYSSDDHNTKISGLKNNGFPKELILAIIAQEIGGSSFDNEVVSHDYGHGVMQITMDAYAHENPSPSNKYFGVSFNKSDPRGKYSEIRLNLCKEINSSQYKNCYKNTETFNTKLKLYDNYEHNLQNQKYKQYSNTAQSVYASIKDGMGILKEKDKHVFYNACLNNFTLGGFVFTCSEINTIKSVWGYNGAVFISSVNYMRLVSERLKNLSTYFTGINYHNNDNLIEKLAYANDHRIEIKAHSPIEVRIIDENDNFTGLINGEEIENIWNAVYDKENERAAIFFPDENYTYEVVGDGTGDSYGLDITNFDFGNTGIMFKAIDIPIQKGEIHKYHIDWGNLDDSSGVFIEIDKNGDGEVDYEIKSGDVLTNISETKNIRSSGSISFYDPDFISVSKQGQSEVDFESSNEDTTVSINKIVKRIDFAKIKKNLFVQEKKEKNEYGAEKTLLVASPNYQVGIVGKNYSKFVLLTVFGLIILFIIYKTFTKK
ncbi:MAG TPA: hypothetical protein PLO44_01025 [Candidatus Paceibacterota bacterium]|nr:hypothetical protein [Candidatus Paceibacterota bacterium]